MEINKGEKSKLVNSVFNDVYNNYDLMNDIMSFGIHRIWKKNLIDWAKPTKNSKVIDVGAGTGDISKLCSLNTSNKCEIYCAEPNIKMLNEGKKRLKRYSNIKWFNAYAEKLPFDSEIFDIYFISFGIRNVNDIDNSLKEAYRVLKKGGRFFCLEFSKVENELLNVAYRNYSKIIPSIGKLVTGSKASYSYLIKSIEEFYSQEELLDKMISNNFSKVEFRNLSNGIAAIHTGWKI